MKYRKGSFIVVPNLSALHGQDPMVQCLFMWLCHFANQDGECYPSVETLVNCTGMSRGSVKNKMKVLIDLKIVRRKIRKKSSKNNQTNLYTILIRDRSRDALRRSRDDRQGGQEMTTELYPMNYTYLTKKKGFKKTSGMESLKDLLSG